MANSLENVVATIYKALLVLPPETLKRAYQTMSPAQLISFQTLLEQLRFPGTHPAVAQHSDVAPALLEHEENIGTR